MLLVGSGAVNLSVAGWLHPYVQELSFLVRTSKSELIDKGKFRCKYGDADWQEFTCMASSEISELSIPDIVVIGVKSYALADVSAKISSAFGADIPVVSVLNGVRHIQVLEQTFRHVVLATIFYNAYRVSPSEAVVVPGPIALSSSTDVKTVKQLRQALSHSTPIKVIDNPNDVAHCKLIMNLGNALQSIVGYHDNRSRDVPELQRLTANLMWEGVQVLKKHGIKEVKLPGVPSWMLIKLAVILPSFIVVPIFNLKMKALAINSMAQDVANGSEETELEDLNGYLVELAEKLQVDVPYNKVIYQTFKKWNVIGTQPIKPSVLLSRINSFSNR